MIQRLSIKNFKSWANLENMEFGKVTAVFGPNSSGKTSLIQFLLMLKQTAESRDRRILNLGGTERDYVDLGSYEDVVYGHHISQSIEFNVGFISNQNQNTVDLNTEYQIKAGFKIKDKKIFIDELVFLVSEDEDQTYIKLIHKQKNDVFFNIYSSGSGFDLAVIGDNLFDFNLDKNDFMTRYASSQVLTDGLWDFFELEKIISNPSQQFSLKLKNIHYLGPLREYPKREYRWTGEVPQSIGIRGEYAVQTMLSKIQSVQPAEQAELIKDVSKWLKRFGVIDELDLSSISKNSRLFELKIKSRNYAHWANLMDVGFGVSQVLPVIVLAYFAPPGSIIILEQPEIHLHPSVQAELADLFLEVALTRNVQFFIESHSEHLLMRLQRRVAERSGEFANLTENDVKLYFCKRETDASILEPLEMDEYGRIKNWPKEFFGDPLGERAAMTKAMLARKMAMNGQNGHKA
ncbi:MAG: DUF3696 domain-containing protein [Anaerolineae bacterium]|nr:DUF3696 domain-containing protein [Anaerolineae bacterium]